MSKSEIITRLEVIEEEARNARHDFRTMDNPVLPVARRLQFVSNTITEILHQLITGEWSK